MLLRGLREEWRHQPTLFYEPWFDGIRREQQKSFKASGTTRCCNYITSVKNRFLKKYIIVLKIRCSASAQAINNVCWNFSYNVNRYCNYLVRELSLDRSVVIYGFLRNNCKMYRNSCLSYTHKCLLLAYNTVIEVLYQAWCTQSVASIDGLTTLWGMLRIILFSKFLFLKIFLYNKIVFFLYKLRRDVRTIANTPIWQPELRHVLFVWLANKLIYKISVF